MIGLPDRFRFISKAQPSTSGKPSVPGFSSTSSQAKSAYSNTCISHTAPIDSVHFASRSRLNSPSGLQRLVNDGLLSEAANGNLPQVKWLLAKGLNIDHANLYTGKTALMQAADNNQSEVLQYLLFKEANQEKMDYERRTALLLAARSGHLDCLEILLEAGARTNATDKDGLDALLLAVNSNRQEVVKFLLDDLDQLDYPDRKLKNWNIETKDYRGRTPLQLAAQKGYTELVQDLVARNARLESRNSDGMTPLMLATCEEKLPTVKVLIDAGAQVNAHNRAGMTPLMFAVNTGNLKMARFLLEHGAHTNLISESQETALALAVCRNNLPMVKLLMAYGAELGVPNHQGITPLMEAVRLGYEDMTKALLKYPAEVQINHLDRFGFTALSYAANLNRREAILKDLLQAAGVDLEVRDTAQNTPLLLAAQRGDDQSVRMLIEHGADVHVVNSRLASALHFACTQGKYDLVKFLLARDINTNSANLDGATPLLLAAKGGHHPIVEMLLQHQGKPQRPYTQAYQQLRNYVDVTLKQDGLDPDQPFEAHLPELAKRELFRLTELLYLVDEGKPLTGLSWHAQREMSQIIDSSRAGKNEKDPDQPLSQNATQKAFRDDRWRNLEFLARHNVDMQPTVLTLILALKEQNGAKKQLLSQPKESSLQNAMEKVLL